MCRCCDVFFWKKTFLTWPKKLVVFIQKAVERKRNTLGIMFYVKNVGHRNFAKEMEENALRFSG